MIAPVSRNQWLDEVAGYWRVARHDRMRVEARLLGDTSESPPGDDGEALAQLCHVAALPGVVEPVVALPDVHCGCGAPVGCVAAFDARAGGVIVPGGIGYDINCGHRLLRSDLDAGVLLPRVRAALQEVNDQTAEGARAFTLDDVHDAATHGAGWAIARGCGVPADADRVAARGAFSGADARQLTARALRRGQAQLGTLGGGDHFIELGCIARLLDLPAAERLGLRPGQLTVLIHSGSRALGSEVCSHAIDEMQHAAQRYRISLPDRQLACAPLLSEEGQRYYAAMSAAANYAFANRQVLTHAVRTALARVLGLTPEQLGLAVMSDAGHNLAQWEEHTIAGQSVKLCVHRRGAVRALPSEHPALPAACRGAGQPLVETLGRGLESLLLLPGPGAAAAFHSLPSGRGRRDLHDAPARIAVAVEGERETGQGLEATSPAAVRAAWLRRSGLATPVATLRPLGVLHG